MIAPGFIGRRGTHPYRDTQIVNRLHRQSAPLGASDPPLEDDDNGSKHCVAEGQFRDHRSGVDGRHDTLWEGKPSAIVHALKLAAMKRQASRLHSMNGNSCPC